MDLSIGPASGAAFFLMVFDVWLINLVKRLLCRAHGKHLGLNFDRTPNISSEWWIAAAIAIPVIICLVVGLDLVASILGGPVAGVNLPHWTSGIASGVLVGMGAQKTYDVTKSVRAFATSKGIVVPKSWSPGGENDVSTVTPPAAPTVPPTS